MDEEFFVGTTLVFARSQLHVNQATSDSIPERHGGIAASPVRKFHDSLFWPESTGSVQIVGESDLEDILDELNKSLHINVFSMLFKILAPKLLS